MTLYILAWKVQYSFSHLCYILQWDICPLVGFSFHFLSVFLPIFSNILTTGPTGQYIYIHCKRCSLIVLLLQFLQFSYCTLYIVWEKEEKPVRKPYPLPYGLRNPYRNLKSENSQDYAQKPQQNWTFMNSATRRLAIFDCTNKCLLLVALVYICFPMKQILGALSR